jgi:hypothetical protein
MMKAKDAQGYNPKPVWPECRNCAYYTSEKIEKEYYGDRWDEEKKIRCALGGFAIKKTATCNKYKLIL